MTIRILQGDCREVMATLPEASVDAIVTDPPYELGFMGKGWDRSGVANDIETWRLALHVLKPGGHLLAFSGTRTYHRMVCAIEDAGFEIRDQIGWVYGSGFPKSLDVSKAIDSRGGSQVAWFGPWFRKWREGKGITQKQVAALFPSRSGGLTGCVANWELGLNMPTPEQFNLIRDTFGLPFDSVEAAQREVIKTVDASRLAVAPGQDNDRSATSIDITAPATDAARQWQGWGTALKPAWEPIVVARKPLIGTVAENVLQFGTGAINVDGCRVGMSQEDREFILKTARPNTAGQAHAGTVMNRPAAPTVNVHDAGRWPANLIHDGSDEVLAVFPAEAGGQDKRQGLTPGMRPGGFGNVGADRGSTTPNGRLYGDTGSAARFFYSAKADAADRNEGLPHGQRNTHPTVKPTDLMRYLCRLVTPPGGTVLDPFAGSGSTLKAAELEGFAAIGIELSAEYIAIARLRIAGDAPLFAEVHA